jgi:hypothetical protein
MMTVYNEVLLVHMEYDTATISIINCGIHVCTLRSVLSEETKLNQILNTPELEKRSHGLVAIIIIIIIIIIM